MSFCYSNRADEKPSSLPHGTCPSVGVGGHATLGGFGYDSRQWGLLSDTMVGLDVVLANGTTVSVSATQHSELFWAARGAGPGFVIVTAFHFQTLPAPSVNINYGYTYSFTSASSAASGFQYATNWALQNAPKELGFGIYMDDGKRFVIQGAYQGTKSAFTTLIAPLLAGMKTFNQGKTPSTSVIQLGWIDSLTALAGSSLVTPPNGDGSHDTFVSTPLPLSLLSYETNIASMSNPSKHANQRRSPSRPSKTSSHTSPTPLRPRAQPGS